MQNNLAIHRMAVDHLRSLLWDDVDVFQERYEKSANALVLIKQRIAADKSLSQEHAEFLQLYARVADADPDLFTRVWRDPTAYYWARLTYELLVSAIGDRPLPTLAKAHCDATELQPSDALRRQIAAFKRFALGLGVLGDEDWSFQSPVEVELPFAIPGTVLSVDGEGTATIEGLHEGRLLVRVAGREIALNLARDQQAKQDIVLSRAPTATWKICQVVLQPHAFNNLPAIIHNDPVIAARHAYQQEFADIISRGLELMERYHPRAFAQFSEVMSVLAVKPLGDGDYVNVSYSDLPGACIISATANPYEMADVLIHEFHHNRLFFVEETGPFFEDTASAVKDTCFYSPWRKDPRALMGILHGLYVFIPVREFWGAVARDEDLTMPERAFARTWVARNTLELSIAVHQLGCHARFSAFGQQIFEELAEIVRRLRDEMRGDGLSYDEPALAADDDGTFRPALSEIDGRRLSVRDAVLRHLKQHAPEDQFEDILRGVDFN